MNQELGPQRAKVKQLYDPKEVHSKWGELLEKMPLIFLRGNLMPGARVLDGKDKSREA